MENNQKYVEFVEHNIANRNEIIPLDLYLKTIKASAFSKKEMYRSYYSFDIEFANYVEEHTSVKDYDGIMFLDTIILDIDKGTMPCDEFKMNVEDCINTIRELGVRNEHIVVMGIILSC